MDIVSLLIIWIIGGIVVVIIARARGLGGAYGLADLGWFVYAVVLLPIAFVHALVATDAKAGEKRARRQGRVPCPHCAEFVMAEAKICPHCRTALRPAAAE